MLLQKKRVAILAAMQDRGCHDDYRVHCHSYLGLRLDSQFQRARLGLSPAKRPTRGSAKPIVFARVVVKPSATAATPAVTEALRLHLAGGRELIIPASMPVERVATLVHAIEGRPSITEAAP